VLEGKHSSRSEDTSGVPRRAVFRPLLFLILLNHITKNTSSTANLEYAATIWDPYIKLNLIKLEKYQRRAVIFVNGDYSGESSVTSMLNEPTWPALQQRRPNTQMVMMYRIVQMSSLSDL
jgi:hypothetical protein